MLIIPLIAAQQVKQQFICLIHKKNLESLDCIHLQLDHNALFTCNHRMHCITLDFIMTCPAQVLSCRKPLIHNFIVSVNGFLGKLYHTFWVQKCSNYYLLMKHPYSNDKTTMHDCLVAVLKIIREEYARYACARMIVDVFCQLGPGVCTQQEFG